MGNLTAPEGGSIKLFEPTISVPGFERVVEWYYTPGTALPGIHYQDNSGQNIGADYFEHFVNIITTNPDDIGKTFVINITNLVSVNGGPKSLNKYQHTITIIGSVDNTVRSTVIVTGLLGDSDTGIFGDNITSNKFPTIHGTGDANSKIRIDVDGTVVEDIVTIDSSGSWSYKFKSQLKEGPNLVSASYIDNKAAPLFPASKNITIDTKPPALEIYYDHGFVIESIQKITGLTDRETIGVEISASQNGVEIGRTQGDITGNWNLDVKLNSFGNNDILFTAKDSSGNVSYKHINFNYILSYGPNNDYISFREGDSSLSASQNISTHGVLQNDYDAHGNDPDYTKTHVISVNGLASNVGSSVEGRYGFITINEDGSTFYKNKDLSRAPIGIYLNDQFSYEISNAVPGKIANVTIVIDRKPELTDINESSLNAYASGYGSGNVFQNTFDADIPLQFQPPIASNYGHYSLTSVKNDEQFYILTAESGNYITLKGKYTTLVVKSSGEYSWSFDPKELPRDQELHDIYELSATQTYYNLFGLDQFNNSFKLDFKLEVESTNGFIDLEGKTGTQYFWVPGSGGIYKYSYRLDQDSYVNGEFHKAGTYHLGNPPPNYIPDPKAPRETLVALSVRPASQLFSSSSDEVDFNNLTEGQKNAVKSGLDRYHALDGNDHITYPFTSDAEDSSDFDPSVEFDGGPGMDSVKLPGRRSDYNITRFETDDGKIEYVVESSAKKSSYKLLNVEGIKFQYTSTQKDLFGKTEFNSLITVGDLADYIDSEITPAYLHAVKASEFDLLDASSDFNSSGVGDPDNPFVDKLVTANALNDPSYTFNDGIYKASVSFVQQVLAGVATSKSQKISGGDPPEKNMIYVANTLYVTFDPLTPLGTDSVADTTSLLSFFTRWTAYSTLVDEIVRLSNLSSADNGGQINQVIVTGHSLGGAMAQYFIEDPRVQALSIPVFGVTFGNPGTGQGKNAESSNFINIINTDDFTRFTSGVGLSRAGSDIFIERSESGPIVPGIAEHRWDAYESDISLFNAANIRLKDLYGKGTQYFAFGNDNNDNLSRSEWSFIDRHAAHQVFLFGGDDKIILDSTYGNIVDGGSGYDSIIYAGKRSEYSISTANGTVFIADTRVSGGDQIDELRQIEEISFSDAVYNVGTNKTIPIIIDNEIVSNTPNTPPTLMTVNIGPGEKQTLSNIASGSLLMEGGGTLVLEGNINSSGPTTVVSGTLIVDGTTSSFVTVKNGAVLGGHGSTGKVLIESGGILSPGNSPGILSTKDLDLNAGAFVKVEIGGTSAGHFDQIQVSGSVALGDAKLDVLAYDDFVSIRGDSFIFINNDGIDAVKGTFLEMPEGADFILGSRNYQISYHGGDGNDVVLTDLTQPSGAELSVFGFVEHNTASMTGGLYGLYETILNRSPDPIGLEGFTFALNSGMSLLDISKILLDSEEYGKHDISPSEFVESLYSNTFNRLADAGGLSLFVDELVQGISREEVAMQISTSAEGQLHIKPAFDAGVFVPDLSVSAVARMYYTLLDRAPDAGGLQAFDKIVKQAVDANGTPGVSQSLKIIADVMMESPEYSGLHGPLTDEQFINSLYENALSRQAEPAGMTDWLNALYQSVSRADVAIGISQSVEAQIHLNSHVQSGWHLTT